ELLTALTEAGIPSGTVRTLPEVYEWDQALSQGLKVSVDHPVRGAIGLPGPPLRFFDASGDGEVETTRSRHEASPLLDEDAESIVAWLADENCADRHAPSERTRTRRLRPRRGVRPLLTCRTHPTDRRNLRDLCSRARRGCRQVGGGRGGHHRRGHDLRTPRGRGRRRIPLPRRLDRRRRGRTPRRRH